ncbi:MAG: coiled-coil domain-containing protein [Candidatus Puniceispirillaceae bacterium]
MAQNITIIIMSNLAFDTHKFVKDLTKTGMASDQAEVLADHYARLLDDRLATKDDIALSESVLKADITSVESALRAEIASLESSLRAEIASLEGSLRAEIASVENALRADITSLRKDMMVTILSAQLVSITIICSVIGFMLTF